LSAFLEEMSMLAEPRRKQRISVDPQNLQWGNDESRVGKSMMEKMGWRGGGLGKMENGRRENLKLTANYTQKGLISRIKKIFIIV
jgi:Pin2-interacting protein X1